MRTKTVLAIFIMAVVALVMTSCNNFKSKSFTFKNTQCTLFTGPSVTEGQIWFGAKNAAGQVIIPCDKDSIQYYDSGYFVTYKTGQINLVDTLGKPAVNLGGNSIAFSEGTFYLGIPNGVIAYVTDKKEIIGPYDKIILGPNKEFFFVIDTLWGATTGKEPFIAAKFEQLILLSQTKSDKYCYLGKIKTSKKGEWQVIAKDGQESKKLSKFAAEQIIKKGNETWKKDGIIGLTVKKLP